ncbi:MAG: hypothetical protein K6E95_03105 [Lachnospiraceae bacterium]|nr:hypothetical protein [Lachnospiraceae bacterium]
MAKEIDLNSRTSRLKVAAAGMSQFDMLAVAIVILRFFVYLTAAALVHDYDDKLVIAVAFTEITVIAFSLIYTFKRDIIFGCIFRLLGDVLLAGAGIGVIYVNGIISDYLNEVQMRESVVVLLVFFNILFVICETARTLFTIDVFLAASTSKHRKSAVGIFKTRVRPGAQIIGTSLCFLLLVIPAVFAGKIVSGLDSVAIDSDVYQVIDSQKVFYDYPTTARKQAGNCIIEGKEETEIMLAETPLYFGKGTGTDKILLPRTYALVEPAIASTKKVENLSIITVDDGKYEVSCEAGEREASGFFLYDGRNTYIFFEKTILTVGDNELELSPFSYLTASYNGAVSIFDPSTGSCSTFSLIGRDAVAQMKDGTKIDVGMDILIKTDGVEQMLFMQPSTLDEYVS